MSDKDLLFAVLFNGRFDEVPVHEVTLGIFTSRDRAKTFAQQMFGTIEWLDEELEEPEDCRWNVAYSSERSEFECEGYEPPVQLDVEIIWIRPYELNTALSVSSVFDPNYYPLVGE